MNHLIRVASPVADEAWIDPAPIFGPVEDGKGRHRVSERLSKLNKLARPYGVRLVLDEPSGKLLVRHHAAQQLRRFQSKLLEGSGAIQRAVAHELGRRIACDPSCHLDRIDEFAKLQLAEMPAWVGKPLQFALGLSLDALFLDAPYALISARGDRGPTRSGACAFLRAALRQPQPFHGLLIGEPGSGKTAALYRVFQELSRLHLAGQLAQLPILIPAGHAEIHEGRLCWRLGRIEKHLRDRPDTERSLRLLESSGKALFLIDALDENPGLVDFSRTEVVKAWQTVLRNRCVVSCRNRFFAQSLRNGILGGGSARDGRWTVVSLSDWSRPQAQSFYRRLAGCPIVPPREARVSAAEIKSAVAHLGRLSEKNVPAGTAAFRPTPLNLWLDSLFVASNRGRLPRNEYELLEFAADAICRWQAAKKGILPPEAMMGLLGRAACASYRLSRGRERRFVRSSDAAALLEAQAPSLLARKEAALRELEAHPLVDSDPASGLLWIDPHFCDFLAARHLIQTLRVADAPRVIEQFSEPVLWDLSRFFDEGVDCVDDDGRASVAEALIEAFQRCEKAYARNASFSLSWPLNQLGYHLGRMNHDRSREFLHAALREKSPALKSPMCAWGIVIGLALSGDASEIDPYVDGLEKKPERFRLNMAYCQLYFMDKIAEGGDYEAALERPSPAWARSCDAIIAQLSAKTFRNIRLLDVFALRRFLEELGPGPFKSEAGPRRERALREALSRLAPEHGNDPKLAEQVRRLRKTLLARGVAA